MARTTSVRTRAKARTNGGVQAPANETELLTLLARRLRQARASRGMTRRQLAAQSRISLAYLARLESGSGNVSLGLLHKLATALNLPLESFLADPADHGADFALILEFLKRQRPDDLARIRRLLFDKFGHGDAAEAERIALVGIRGVGKSTLGPRLAERVGVPFVELNREIEKEAGIAVSEIFNLYGQHGYRQLERRALERVILAHPKVVLATGGGIVTEPGTYELLLSSCYTIWLQAKPQSMFERVMAQHDARIASPQLRSEAMENIAHTLEARRHLYELAHAAFDTSGKSVEQALRGLLAIVPSPGHNGALGQRSRA